MPARSDTTMTQQQTSSFSDVDPMTIRQPAPLGIGVYGYGGAGKTETALRLAFGIQRVYGGDVFYADTESRKGLAYRRLFPFRYIDFRAPHNALRYIELIRTFSQRKGVLVIDTFTEEHDGEGGMLETQAEAKGDRESRNAVAWALAKGQHKKLPRVLRQALQTIPIIGTWRAEDKTDWNHKDERGKVTPVPKGEMPIGSRDVPFEMTLHFLMRAGAKGVPCLRPETYGEDIMTKIPRWFDGLFRPDQPITEEHGEALAGWAMAEAAPEPREAAPKAPDVDEMRAAFEAARTPQQIEAAAAEWGPRFPKEDRKRRPAFVRAYTDAKARAEGASAPPKPPSNPGERPPPLDDPDAYDRSA
jgi:hypothetical protein